MKIKDMIKKLKRYDQEREILDCIWLEDDVFVKAEDMEIELTRNQMKNIISNMENKHDAEVGVNWDVIEYWIDQELNK